MAFKSKRKGNEKYLRLTGLWQSKSNDALWTGRLKAEQVEDLFKKVEEAVEAGAPIVFSLWENDKKESPRDPEFSLQCFVGDSEESPRSSRSSRNKRSSGSSRRSNRDKEDNDGEEDSNEDSNEEDNDESGEEEPEEKPNRKASKRSSREEEPRGKKRSSGW